MMNDTTSDAALQRANGSPKGLMQEFADQYGLSVEGMYHTLADTIFPSKGQATKEQVHALLIVAREHKLNPWAREIWAFPGKGGGIVPIVGVDGWFKLASSHPQCDGIQVTVDHKDGRVFSATCRIHRKDWRHPTEITEYLSECARNTDPWRKQPVRMLRHRAIAQCARIAFGFGGIYEPDEAARFAADIPQEHREAESEVISSMNERIASVDAPPQPDAPEDAEFTEATEKPQDAPEYVPEAKVEKLVAAFAKVGMDREAVADDYGPLDAMTFETFAKARATGEAMMRDQVQADEAPF